MARVELQAVRKSFGTVDVIHGIDLDLASGEFVVFVGPSGCGKSTLLRMIAGLEDISGGELRIGGEKMNDVLPAKRGCAMVFQSYALYPHMTVRENMAFGLEQARLSKREIEERVTQSARMLQIDHLMDRKPKALSGGQRQRVAIGRAISRQPRVFLFDEPLSNLDAALRVDTRIEIAALHHRLHDTTMIYVTHDQVEAMTLADRIVVLNAGKVEQVGTPMDLYERPASRFVASFIGSPRMNLIEGATAEAMGAACVGIRPEHLHVAQDGPWAGKVVMAEALGSDTFLHVETAEAGRVVVRIPPGETPTPGTALHLAPDAARLHRFGADGAPLA
ncbi:ABC transporter ATP-binding protein [Maritimibacter sp. HL-12]|jgi:multiple sugar transport system ATP-binding protein|uniref:ABC transporter ATP-binding protein n=1 Tax=Maritimibacter sp. HL-12 TaxID=1162418 RepID=UPI000A0F1341|nr:sn-glycerol-3-phosphate ABC transporter ATP-binding protein UgpC [Maritimibacter sp. HL-12]SMH37926.1 multiple sugar transport system ATP-binding protein [Maritimibacter sp. HL-12]